MLFESPNRIMKTLAAMNESHGARHEVFVGFELTKKFETHYRGSVNAVMEQLSEY